MRGAGVASIYGRLRKQVLYSRYQGQTLKNYLFSAKVHRAVICKGQFVNENKDMQ